MKIKEVQAGVKLSSNYDSYQASLVAEVDDTENPEKIGEELIEKALGIVNKKVSEFNKNKISKNYEKRIEIGGAWPDKNFNDRLSVKDSRTGKWKKVMLNELEVSGNGYKQETDEGIFIFRKIPEDRRKNDKMPMYRIYKTKM